MKKNHFFIILVCFIIIVTVFVIVKENDVVIRDSIFVEIDPTRPVVALTFDDGPNDPYTLKILDILYENDSVATFFINGMNVPGNEDILRKIVGEGNELSNHTNDHIDLTSLTKI